MLTTPVNENTSLSSPVTTEPHAEKNTSMKRSNVNSTMGSKNHGSMKKKLTIRPFKKLPVLPESYEEESWKKLHSAVVAVQKKQAISFSKEELYNSVRDLCIWKLASNLYAKLQACCASYIAERVHELSKHVDVSTCVTSMAAYIQNNPSLQEDASSFLELVAQFWEDHCNDMLVVRTIFLYLDRTFVLQTPHVASIWDMGLALLRQEILRCSGVERHLIASILVIIEKERCGELVNRLFLYKLLRMLLSLQLYQSRFAIPFLSATEQFYTTEGVRLVEQMNVSQFLSHVERRLHEENDRVVHYLDPSTTKKQLIHALEVHLLKPHVSTLLNDGMEHLISSKKVEDLQRMFVLFARVDALQEMKTCFGNCIRTRVNHLVTNEEQEHTLVENLLQVKSDLDEILTKAFSNNQEFSFVLKNSMEHAINTRPNRPAELLAKFVDAKLRTGNKGGSEIEVEAILDRVIVLFRYIQGKDIFEAFYKKDLAKRLLLRKSASFDLEKLMLSKLKTECGSSFTNKLEGMFKDIDLSQNVVTQFLNHVSSRAALKKLAHDIDLHVQVLTTGYWPAYAPVEINLPNELEPLKDIFEKFYASKHQGRQLQWQHSLGHCLLKVQFKNGKKELSVSLFQATVLLCFNMKKTIGFREIKEQTRIENDELRRTLQSLACGKIRVIFKEPKSKEVQEDDIFHFNDAFTNQLFRIKINAIQMKETKEENDETHERVFRDRQYQVDAAIVRIMKARKKLSHTLLMSEIYAQLKFPAKPADIKRRIESLIDREYLERDHDNAQVYNYLA